MQRILRPSILKESIMQCISHPFILEESHMHHFLGRAAPWNAEGGALGDVIGCGNGKRGDFQVAPRRGMPEGALWGLYITVSIENAPLFRLHIAAGRGKRVDFRTAQMMEARSGLSFAPNKRPRPPRGRAPQKRSRICTSKFPPPHPSCHDAFIQRKPASAAQSVF